MTKYKEFFKLIAFWIAVEAVKVIIAVAVGWISSLFLIPAAYAERGYSAIGGEWLLIIGFEAITYYLLSTAAERIFK